MLAVSHVAMTTSTYLITFAAIERYIMEVMKTEEMLACFAQYRDNLLSKDDNYTFRYAITITHSTVELLQV